MTTSATFPRRYRAAALIAGLAGGRLLSPPTRSQAQAVKEQPKAEPKKAAKAQPKAKAARTL